MLKLKCLVSLHQSVYYINNHKYYITKYKIEYIIYSSFSSVICCIRSLIFEEACCSAYCHLFADYWLKTLTECCYTYRKMFQIFQLE